MGILSNWLSHAPVDEFAKTLANDIAKRYPPALDKEPGKRPSVNRLTRIVEDTCKHAVEFKESHRLGWLGRARLSNTFRWEMVELGYQKDFVDLATEAVVVEISRSKRA